MMACSKAFDADASDVNAFSPSDAVRMAVAWAAVMPTVSRFSVNTVSCSLADVKTSRADFNELIRSLHEQRR